MLNHFWHNSAILRVVTATLLALLLWNGVVQAHSELLSAEPAAGETVNIRPQEIKLTFSEPLGVESKITLRDIVLREVATTSSVEGNVLIAQLEDLPAGEYTVEYQAMSADGHSISGSYQFGVVFDGQQTVYPAIGIALGIATAILGRMAYRRWQGRNIEHQE